MVSDSGQHIPTIDGAAAIPGGADMNMQKNKYNPKHNNTNDNSDNNDNDSDKGSI